MTEAINGTCDSNPAETTDWPQLCCRNFFFFFFFGVHFYDFCTAVIYFIPLYSLHWNISIQKNKSLTCQKIGRYQKVIRDRQSKDKQYNGQRI